MVKIIIVDNHKETVKKIVNIIKVLNIKNDCDIKVNCYQKLDDSLLQEIKCVEFQKIYIIGVDLDDKASGIDIANTIRENDWDSELIMMSNHTHMFETVYRNTIKIYNFIEKFYHFETRLQKDLENILQKKIDRKVLIYETRNTQLRLLYKNILYIYRDTLNRKLIVVTEYNKFMINSTLTEIMEKLDSRFVVVHRACILNIEKAVYFDWKKGYFELRNKDKVHLLSKKYKKNIK